MRRFAVGAGLWLAPLLFFVSTSVVWWWPQRACFMVLGNEDCWSLTGADGAAPLWMPALLIGAAVVFAAALSASLARPGCGWIAALSGLAVAGVGLSTWIDVPGWVASQSSDGQATLGPGPGVAFLVGCAMLSFGLALTRGRGAGGRGAASPSRAAA